MARWARDEGLILRFIEFMDVGHTNGWRLDEVVPQAEILAADRRRDAPRGRGRRPTRARLRTASGTATASGEVGVIASVTQPFCGSCTRARLSAEGELYTCLFAAGGTDLKAPLRAGATTRSSRELIRPSGRSAPIAIPSCGRPATADLPRVEMFAIGG